MNYIQPQFIKYNLTMIEWMILDYIMKAFSWADKKEIDWIECVKLHSQKILDDIPVLGISTTNWLGKHIKKLIDRWLITKRVSRNSPYYAITKYTRDYEYAGVVQMERKGGPDGTLGLSDWNTNSNINYSNIKDITIPFVQIKEKSKSLIKELEALLLSLSGEWTDLNDVSADSIITLRNWYYNKYKLPRIKEGTVMYTGVKTEWAKFKKEFTKEEFNLWLKNYLDEIDWRQHSNDPWSYFNHRHTLFNFLKQKNWIRKFIYM